MAICSDSNSILRSKVPLSEEKRKRERNKIIEIGEKNGFKRQEIDKLVNKVEEKERMETISILSEGEDEIILRKFTHHPYHPIANYKFQKIFKKFKINLSFNNRVNLTNKQSTYIKSSDTYLLTLLDF